METKNYRFDWQTFERSFAVAKGLPTKADAYTDMGRITSIILKNMFYVQNLSIDQSSDNSNAIVGFDFNAVNIGVGSASINLSVPSNGIILAKTFRTGILNWANTNLSQSYIDADVVIASLGFALEDRGFSNPSLAINTSRQPSTTRDTLVNASVDVTTTLSLSGGTAGKVELKYADDTGITTNVKTVNAFTNSNTGTLTVGLNTSQIGTASLTGIVPAGKYYRLVTTNVTGTPTYGTPVIQEVLL